MESNRKYPLSPTVAVVAGVVGALLAALYFVANTVPPGGGGQVSGTRVYESMLLASEGLVSLSFAVLALFLYVQTRTVSSVGTAAYLAAAARALFLAWQFGGHWRPGWHYIMDPADTTGSSWSLIVAGVVQVGAFVAAAQWSVARAGATEGEQPPS